MITLHHIYLAAGVVFALFAALGLADASNPKRLGNGLFWGLVALSFLAGDLLGDRGNGVLAIALALIAGFNLLGRGKARTTSPEERTERATRHGNRLFAAALVVPAVTFGLSLAIILPQLIWKHPLMLNSQPFLGAEQPTVVALVLGIASALALAMAWLRPAPIVPIQEGRALLDSIGWAAILPQALASLGLVFTAAGVGKAVGALMGGWIPIDNGLLVVAAYTGGMALFTILMGNAFAAFPIMTAAIGLPLIVGHLHGDVVIMGAIGMLSGFCGTLMTPMAANFNVVPAVLLELPDRNSIFNGVIRAQAPTGLMLLVVNTLLMYALVFRF